MAVTPTNGQVASHASHPGRATALVALVAAMLVTAYLLAIGSTHQALSGGDVGWSGPVAGHGTGLRPITKAESQLIESPGSYSSVLWATRPGGEISFGFDLHNGGLIPVTVTGIAVRDLGRFVVRDLEPARALLGPDRHGAMAPFHRVAIGPGSTVAVGLTERVVCDPTIASDARNYGAGGSWLGDASSPVIVRYRALGVSTSQTVALGTPVLVGMFYGACG